MSGGLGGVVRHEVRLEGAVPVAVTLVLARGAEVEVDLVRHTVTQRVGAPLTARQEAWVREIGGYLARQHLLEIAEERRASQTDGRAAIPFEPRPKPGMIWWG
ncbi:MAG: hypothetical protein HQL97_10385 [Magnetococcales bacterium]|nr:hypothetical protein [Magnetococcales bacterium]